MDEEGQIRQQWFGQELSARVSSFGEEQKVRVACLTWNVNGKNVVGEPSEGARALQPWLWTADRTDVYAIGLQEMVDLTAVNVVADGKSAKKRAESWRETLDQALGPLGFYDLVAQKHMVGVLLCVYARRGLACSEAAAASVGCGVMGMLGNKGGVSVRVRVWDSTLCFVCSHLAAHRENVEGRNSDVATILAKTEFRGRFNASLDEVLLKKEPGGDPLRIEDHDAVFWLGDLNYRVHATLDTNECFGRCDANDWDVLKAHDQLNIERAAGQVFVGFDEAPLAFPVTYKYQPGTSLLERRPEKKLRAPAWCDRVLWKTGESTRVSLKSYEAVMDLLPSDHKPVRAVFETTLFRIDMERRNQTLQSLGDALDVTGGDVDFGDTSVFLGTVRYAEPVTRQIQATNRSSRAAHWRFVPPRGAALPDFTASKKPWMRVSPHFGTLLPGQSCVISVTVTVDKTAARALNAKSEALADALVVRVGARDTLFHVSGEWLPSTFGMSLEDLCVRTSATKQQTSTTLPVPKVLWRLLDALAPAVDVQNLFYKRDADRLADIAAALDDDKPFPDNLSPYSLADALVDFLAALATPLLPRHLLPNETADDLRAWVRDFLARLPPAQYNTFVYCLAFFRHLLEHSPNNLLTPAKLAAVLCACMLPRPDHTSVLAAKQLPKRLNGCFQPDLMLASSGHPDFQRQRAHMNTILKFLLTTNAL